ncbi:hypothetical protein MGG_16521 [Pyricularia oryzae 70-15]|uniref:Uncharacterized protein n=3 Tax=Pyricularia oryzae TaxID=318829 RepID=G4MS93_PYRO7|nr:uncharacterized protein MGG_16521 [Pyricularia oryzae 70-15]EHA58351.1 hypothetical protein MGG_16521 [Pyricularia oryzae 70-15]ELQ33039.1 hypothetical protein OOU_Y34scaffold01005g65 [Pyricularia oryzae Y34]
MESRELLIPQSRGSFPRTNGVQAQIPKPHMQQTCVYSCLAAQPQVFGASCRRGELTLRGTPLMIKVYEASRKLAIDGSRDIDCWLDRAKANGFTHGIPTSTI